MNTDEDVTTAAAGIASEIRKVHQDSYGTDIPEVQVIIEGDTVLVLGDIELTRAETTLLQAGLTDAIRVSREAYQEAVAPTFSAIVERATGRRVISFLSAMSIEPLYVAELFRLQPNRA